jgi:hypothetical protein
VLLASKSSTTLSRYAWGASRKTLFPQRQHFSCPPGKNIISYRKNIILDYATRSYGRRIRTSIPCVAGFVDLPVELRQQIWQFAIQAPQNITAKLKYSVPRNPSYRQLVLLGAYCPISQVNSEARRGVLLYLQQQESIGKPTLPAIVAIFNI